VLAKEDDNARLDNIVVVYYILVVVVVRESYSKNPLMRLVFVVNSENEKKQTEKEAKKTAKAKFCLFVFLLSR
jgi:maltoporin